MVNTDIKGEVVRNKTARNKLCFIRVKNMDTGVVYKHGMVPYEHAMTLKLSPNLEVDIIKSVDNSLFQKGRRNEDKV